MRDRYLDYLSIHPAIHLSFHLFIFLSIYINVSKSIYLSIHPAIHPSIYLSISTNVNWCLVRPSLAWAASSGRETFVWEVAGQHVACKLILTARGRLRGRSACASESAGVSRCHAAAWQLEHTHALSPVFGLLRRPGNQRSQDLSDLSFNQLPTVGYFNFNTLTYWMAASSCCHRLSPGRKRLESYHPPDAWSHAIAPCARHGRTRSHGA